jgi:hypothetical protein
MSKYRATIIAKKPTSRQGLKKQNSKIQFKKATTSELYMLLYIFNNSFNTCLAENQASKSMR